MNRTAQPVQVAGFRTIITAFSAFSSTTLIATMISALSNKLISLYLGTHGIAVLGLYRGLGSFLAAVITFGFTTTIAQQMSQLQNKQEANRLFSATLWVLVLQWSCGALVATFLGSMLAHWMLGYPPSVEEILNTRIVIAATLTNITLQTVIAIIRGSSNWRWITSVQIVTALSTLALLYPLMRLGDLGLAVNIGSGSLIGAVLGLYAVHSLFSPRIAWGDLQAGLRHLRHLSIPSFWATLDGLVTLGALFTIQTKIGQHYGLEALGNYNAAVLIIDTCGLIFLTSLRSFFLPRLGGLTSNDDKVAFTRNMVTVLLTFGFLGSGTLILGAKFWIWLLFSSQFVEAAAILQIFAVSFISLVLMWSYNTLLIHKGANREYVIVNLIWSGFLILGATICLRLNLPMRSIAWSYTITCGINAILYAVFVAKVVGTKFIDWHNMQKALMLTLALALLLKITEVFGYGL